MNTINVHNDFIQLQGRPPKGRKRKIPNQLRSDAKRLRNKNKPYFNQHGEVVEPKIFDENFICNCTKKCTKKVGEFRRKFFNQFWSIGTYEGRCAIILGCVSQMATKRTYTKSGESKRAVTRKYTIFNEVVCKTAFLKTLQIDACRVNLAFHKQCADTFADERGKFSGGQNKMSWETKEQIIVHINSFPKYISHYCRKVTNAKFLSPELNLAKMYELYEGSHEHAVSFSSYKRIFYDCFNLRFKTLQKYTCQRCDKFDARKKGATGDKLLKIEREHTAHLEKAETLSNLMKEDLASAKIDPELEVLSYDHQKTHPQPNLRTNIAYYKRKLNLYNFGIHVGSSEKGIFNVWLENEGGKGTQEVGSCLKKYIETIRAPVKKLILWSDACGGQNRSIKLILMLIHILQNHSSLESISVRFLQPGHSFLPNDSEFGDVECKLKKTEKLHTTDDYLKVDSYTIGTHEILIEKSNPSIIKMKQNPGDEFQTVSIQKRGQNVHLKDISLEKLWPNGKALSREKLQDLKELLTFLSVEDQQKYSFFKNIAQGDFLDDIDGFGENIDFEVEEED